MNKPTELGLRVAFSAAILGLGFVGMRALGRAERPQPPQRPTPLPRVETLPAAAHRGEFEFDVDGVVVPYREVNIAAEVAGRVTYKSPNCLAGRPVREGDLLFRIDDLESALEIRRLEEEVDSAQGMIEELAVEIESAAQQVQLADEERTIRVRELARFEKAPDPSVFSLAEIDAAKRNELTARNNVQNRKDQVRLLKARKRRVESNRKMAEVLLERAELDQQRCEVRARISGVITSESVEQEGFVQKGGMLLSIRDTSQMEVRCSLQMRQLQWLWDAARSLQREALDTSFTQAADGEPRPAAAPGTDVVAGSGQGYQFPSTRATVVYHLNGVPYAWQGTLGRYADSGVDEQTRMVPCIVEVDDPHKAARLDDPSLPTSAPPTLLNGMFVNVRVHVLPSQPLLRLPARSVGPGGDVWLVEDGKLQRIQANVIHADDRRVLVAQSGPLQPGAAVIVSAMVNPLEGAQVEMIAGEELTGRDL